MNDDNRTLKKHISALRRKLENRNSGYTINAVYGEGYSLEPSFNTPLTKNKNLVTFSPF